MKVSSILVALFSIFTALHVIESSIVKRETRNDGNFPGCGRKPQTNEGSRKKRSPVSPADSPNSSNCTNTNVEKVIVGGSFAAPNAWPWMVAIVRIYQEEYYIICGGSIITRKYVLTAGHCFIEESNPEKLKLMIGDNTFKKGQMYGVEKILVHPKYKPDVFYNDIAIITVAKDITLNDNVVPVCLPTQEAQHNIDPDNTEVTIAGWGVTDPNIEEGSDDLKEVTLELLPLENCKKTYVELDLSELPKGFPDNVVCAGGKEGEDSCQGDSGGALVSEMTDGSWVQVGISSFAMGCADLEYPGIYTKVSAYMEWIKKNTDFGKDS